jgi:hypothetical protein
MPGNRKAWGDGKMKWSQDKTCKAATVGSAKMNANCKLQNENCKFYTETNSRQCETASGFDRPSSLIPHPSRRHLPSTIYHLPPSRRGISLMEVLISIFVLSIGLLGVAAIIPLGQLALWETAKADRSGACGRAAMREIQVSRLLDYRYWYWQYNIWGFTPPYSVLANRIPDDFNAVSASQDNMPFVVDPLGYAKLWSLSSSSSFWFGGSLPRRSLHATPLSPSLTGPRSPYSPIPPNPLIDENLFFWSDDLQFNAIKNSIARPRALQMWRYDDGSIKVRLMPPLPSEIPPTGQPQPVSFVENATESSYSWFLTAMPVATEMSLQVASRRFFNVSVVVCYKRNFQNTDSLEGEHTATINANTDTPAGFPGMGIGGGTVLLNNDVKGVNGASLGSSVNVKENQWVMLYHIHFDSSGNPVPQLNRCNWYRVVGVGGSTSTLSLVGPDWDPNLRATLVVVPGAIAVYNTIMELDWDPLWTK